MAEITPEKAAKNLRKEAQEHRDYYNTGDGSGVEWLLLAERYEGAADLIEQQFKEIERLRSLHHCEIADMSPMDKKYGLLNCDRCGATSPTDCAEQAKEKSET